MYIYREIYIYIHIHIYRKVLEGQTSGMLQQQKDSSDFPYALLGRDTRAALLAVVGKGGKADSSPPGAAIPACKTLLL